MSNYDPSRIRNVQHKINGFQAITFLFQNRCSAPAMLYLETLLPFVGDGILRLLEFGPLDIVRAYFRPALFRGGRHFRGGKRGGKRGLKFPELSESIARRLPLAEEAKGRYVADGVRHLWLLDGVLQAEFNNLLVADIIDDTLVGWAQLLRSKACHGVGNTGVIAEKDNLTTGGVLKRQSPGFMSIIWPNPGLTIVPSWNFGPRGGIMTFSGSVKAALPPFFPQTQIIISSDDKVYGASSQIQTTASPAGAVASAYCPPGKSVTVEILTEGGFADWEGMNWTVNQL